MGASTDSFGPFVLDRSRMALLRDDKPLAVGQRGYALLTALLDTDGVVTKTALMEAGWPGTFVEESNLTVQIAALRKALGSRDDGQEWIVTVPRVGYRLLRNALPAAVEAGAERRIPTIAVLPFQNLSGDASQDYFADGVVEDIITALSRFRSLAVVARNSSFVYKGRAVDVRDVSRELGVRYVLEGSVRRAADRLRVVAQLIDAETGAHIWAQNFDGDLADVFAVQDHITATVAGIVSPRLEQAELDRVRLAPPDSLDAYDLVLRGRQVFWRVREQDNADALRLYMKAIDLDPNYGWALASAAEVLQFRASVDWPPLTADDRALCLDLTERAIAAAQGDARILALAGATLAHNYGQYERGLGLLNVALQENPNNTTVLSCAAVAYLHCADVRQSISLAKRAIELAPAAPGQHWALTAASHGYMALGEFEEALAWAERSLAVVSDFECTYWMLVSGNAKVGRLDDARRWLAIFRKMRPQVTIATIRNSQPSRYPDRMANIFEGLRLAGLPEG